MIVFTVRLILQAIKFNHCWVLRVPVRLLEKTILTSYWNAFGKYVQVNEELIRKLQMYLSNVVMIMTRIVI